MRPATMARETALANAGSSSSTYPRSAFMLITRESEGGLRAVS